MSLGASIRSDHLVCSDPLCPTVPDSYTGRIVCRCYQQLETRGYQPNGQITSPPAYSSVYPHGYGLEPATTTMSHLQPTTSMRLENSTYPSIPSTSLTTQFQSSLSPSLATTTSNLGNVDSVLRSQVYNYMNMQYTGYDPNGGRRKNATRETTAALKGWLKEHKKNPYPTKAEKIMLAIVTKMSLTQVSTWFANARRRLKKENKGEWTSDNSNNSSEDENSNDGSLTQLSTSNHDDASNGENGIIHMASTVPGGKGLENGHSENHTNLTEQRLQDGSDLHQPEQTHHHQRHEQEQQQQQHQQQQHTGMMAQPSSAMHSHLSLPSFNTTFVPGNPRQQVPTMDTYQYYGGNGIPSCSPSNTYSQPSSSDLMTSYLSSSAYPSYNYDAVSNYFKQHPQFAHEYNNEAEKENIDVLGSHGQLQTDFLTDSSAGKSSDNESGGQKSTDSSPSSVKSKIWSITEIIGSSMSKINDVNDLQFGSVVHSLLTEKQS